MTELSELFSPLEIEILKILNTKTVTINKLAEQLYKNKEPILNPNNSVACAIRMINKKCVFHDLKWFINGAGLGRGGKTVWKDKRF